MRHIRDIFLYTLLLFVLIAFGITCMGLVVKYGRWLYHLLGL